ncbi:hypothetical protein F2Q70_00013793 [Brassica cretica]|uniref:Uncharacterized protein n=1 Tax=Brassica cretica TaxID=69181 RepID=A0A8S9LTT5_BRACR|nr:hypothetical protein F2Q70_00013793 [Brassica cretica]
MCVEAEGVKWTSESAFKPDGIVWQAIGGSDRSGLRRLGVLGSSSRRYRVAAVGSSDMSSSLLIPI